MALKTLSLVISFSGETDTTENFFQMLQEIVTEYQVEIVGLWPQSPSGAWPEITFLGEEAQLKRLRANFNEELEESDIEECFPLQDTERETHEILVDSRWEGERKYVTTEGKFI